MKDAPKTTWNPQRLDARAFAQAGARLEGDAPLASFARLHTEAVPEVGEVPSPVRWRAVGEMRAAVSGTATDAWLHLQADARITLTCQRCLGPAKTALSVDRWFRFVADEAAAEAQDDDCEEDLLALEPRPSLLEVLEDELLMALPLVPMHEQCPSPVAMRLPDSEVDVVPERKNPFAELAKLKK